MVVGPRTSALVRDEYARHFSATASSLLRMPPRAPAAGDAFFGTSRLEETALKLVFYVSFTIRSRATFQSSSMRLLSMAMMFFWLVSMGRHRREQERYYRLYYQQGMYTDPLYGGMYHSRGERLFWDDFEAGRTGSLVEAERRERGRAALLMQLLALDSVLSRRPPECYDSFTDDEEAAEEEEEGREADAQPRDEAFAGRQAEARAFYEAEVARVGGR